MHIVYILCSGDKTIKQIENCFMSIDSGSDIILMINSNEKINQFEKFANSKNIAYYYSKSDGTASTGHKSCVDHFINSDYDYMSQIDCDDIYKPKSLSKIIEMMKICDCVVSNNFKKINYNFFDIDFDQRYELINLYGEYILKYESRPLCFSKKVVDQGINYKKGVVLINEISDHYNFIIELYKNNNLKFESIYFLDVIDYKLNYNSVTYRLIEKYGKEKIFTILNDLTDQVKNLLIQRGIYR